MNHKLTPSSFFPQTLIGTFNLTSGVRLAPSARKSVSVSNSAPISRSASSNILSYSNPASLRDRSVAGDALQFHATTRSQSTFNRSINFFPLLLLNPDVIALDYTFNFEKIHQNVYL
jgi:hypothetical protein